MLARTSATVRADDAKPDILKNLVHEHPRLYRTAPQWDQLVKDIHNDRMLQRWFDKLEVEANDIAATAPAWPLNGHNSTMICRNTAARMATIAGIYRLTKHQWAADRAKQEVLAIADLDTWEPAGLGDGEMTYAEGLGYDWTYDLLTDEERAKVRKAIIEKGMKPLLECIRTNYHWANHGGNWSEVCNGGIIVGALAIADDEPDFARDAILKARENMNHALVQYNPDGGWGEGPDYWWYGSSYMVRAAAALQTAIGDDLGISKMPGVDKTGYFRIHTTNPFGYVFNFSDSSQSLYPAPWMFWLAKQFNHPEFAQDECRHYQNNPTIWHLIWSDGAAPAAKAPEIPLDALFRNIDVACFRSAWADPAATYVGFKCGYDLGHGHLDYGSFILDAQQERWAVDLGREQYISGYFGAKRWNFLRSNNRGHNTLTINSANQDPEIRSPIVAYQSTPDKAYAVADLSKTYHLENNAWRRGIALLNRRDVLVQDDLSSSQSLDVVWNMFTPTDIQLGGAKATLNIRGEKMYARILSPADAVFQIGSADAPPPETQQPNIHSLQIHLKTAASSPQRIAVLLTPQEDLQAPELQPLDAWISGNEVK